MVKILNDHFLLSYESFEITQARTETQRKTCGSRPPRLRPADFRSPPSTFLALTLPGRVGDDPQQQRPIANRSVTRSLRYNGSVRVRYTADRSSSLPGRRDTCGERRGLSSDSVPDATPSRLPFRKIAQGMERKEETQRRLGVYIFKP
ncbi:uncharacterized protein J3R85_008644 [Psidium guajava]|nr:uncharacterized protein J3R85_008644 [Psidium guajava]